MHTHICYASLPVHGRYDTKTTKPTIDDWTQMKQDVAQCLAQWSMRAVSVLKQMLQILLPGTMCVPTHTVGNHASATGTLPTARPSLKPSEKPYMARLTPMWVWLTM